MRESGVRAHEVIGGGYGSIAGGFLAELPDLRPRTVQPGTGATSVSGRTRAKAPQIEPISITIVINIRRQLREAAELG